MLKNDWVLGFIGMGMVGGNTERLFREIGNYRTVCYDKYKTGIPNRATLTETIEQADLLFIALPTPMSANGAVDLSCISNVLDEIKVRRIIVLRSTIPPGTINQLEKKYPHLDFVMVPEFLTVRDAWNDTINATRIIIGTNVKALTVLLEFLFRSVYPGRDIIIIHLTTMETEAYKYTCNALLAMQILSANQIYFMLQALGLDWERIRPHLLYDKRIGTNLLVPGPDGDFGVGGLCLVKDLSGFIMVAEEYGYTAELFKKAFDFNLTIRKNRDWEKIPGGVSACMYTYDEGESV